MVVSFECCSQLELEATIDIKAPDPSPSSSSSVGLLLRRSSSSSSSGGATTSTVAAKKGPCRNPSSGGSHGSPGRHSPSQGTSRQRFRRLMNACWKQHATPPASIRLAPPLGGCPLARGSAAAPLSPLSCIPDDILLECLARLPRASLHSSLMVCHRWHSLLQSPEYYEHRRKLGNLESLLFVFGSSANGVVSAVYCGSSQTWTAGPLFSSTGTEYIADHPSNQSLVHAQAAVMQHRIYVIGTVHSQNSRYSADDCTIIYDPWSQSITRKAPMLCSRKKFACCVIGNRILVAGGANRRDPSRDPIMDAEEYIPEHDVWKPLASMPRKRYGCLGVAVDGIFYVVGGLKYSNVVGMGMQPYTYINSMDLFDPKTNTWQKTKPLPMGGCVIACTVVRSCIYMLSSHAVELSFWQYDTCNDKWTRIKPPPIPSPLRMDNRLKFSCVTMGTSVYIIQVGGSIDDLLRRSGRHARGLKEGLVLVYDTLLHEWSRAPDLPCMKNGAACAVVQC